MKPVMNFKAVRKLLSKDYPPFVILHHQKLIYITKEAGEVLDISNPAWPLKQSKRFTDEADRRSIPVITSDKLNDDLAAILGAPSFFFPSPFIRSFLQTNKPEAVSFMRWALQGAIPLIEKKKKNTPFTRSGLQLMGLTGSNRNGKTRIVLVAPCGIDAREEENLSGIDRDGNASEELSHA